MGGTAIRGKAARIASGRLPQGTGRTGTAYGYRYDKDTGRRIIEPSEAVVITELFELCATGLSTHKLAKRLNQAEVPSPLSTLWHARTILNILRNPIYVGITYFNRRQRVHISGKRHTYVDRPRSEWAVIDGATPAMVDADLFRTAQARLDQPMVRPVPEYTRYLLSGFLRCSCGGPACGHELQRNSEYRYYRCINCGLPGIRTAGTVEKEQSVRRESYGGFGHAERVATAMPCEAMSLLMGGFGWADHLPAAIVME